MKIDHASEISGVRRVGNAARACGRADALASTAGGTARLIALVHELRGGESGLAEVAELEIFDAERVAELKEAIAEGWFTINPEAVADHLLSSCRETLLTRQKASPRWR